MDILQARITSFKKSKRIKNPSKPSTSATLRWPHPPDFRANSETLAEAGFYYDPSYDDPDNVTCYMCDKELGGWEEDDDPFVIHYSKCSQTCCWASARCGIPLDVDERGKFVSTDKARTPTNKQMEKARHDTFLFGKGWKHDNTPNHGANSKTMARAGFVYTPQHVGDDLATCFYCDTSLSGWEPEDDPIEEHRKRESKTGVVCSFFTSSLDSSSSTKPSSKAQMAKPPSKQSSKPPSKSTSRSKYQDIVQPTKTHDGDLEDDDSGDESTGKAAYVKTPHKGRSTTTRKSSAKTPKVKAKARSSSRTGLNNVVEEDDEDESLPPPAIVKKSRSTSKSTVKSKTVGQTEPEDEDNEPARPPPTVKKSRSTSKSIAKAQTISQTEPEDEEDEPLRPPVTAKKSRSTSKSIAKAELVSQTEPEDDEELRKPSRSRTKKIASEAEEDVPRKSSRSKAKQSTVVPSVNEEETTRKPSRSKAKAKAIGSEQEEPVTAKPKHKRTASKSKSKAAVPIQVSEVESDAEAEIPEVVKKASSKKLKASPQVPAAQNLFDDDVFTDHYVPPPPPSPPPTIKQNVMEMPPLFVPKRNNKTVAPSETKDSVPLEQDRKKPSKPKTKPQPSASSSGDEAMEVHHEASTNRGVPFSRLPSNGSLKLVSTEKSVGSTKLSAGKSEQTMKVVEISSDEEDVVPPPKQEQPIPISRSGTETSSKSVKVQPVAQPTHVAPVGKVETISKSSSTRSPTGQKAVTVEIAKPPTPTPVQRSPSPPATPVVNPDVSMEYVGLPPTTEPGLELDQDAEMLPVETPVTPPRQTAQARAPSFGSNRNDFKPEPIVEDRPPTAAAELPIIPALSKLPFIPLNSLTETELDMTVEEWIRYQMDVEHDKFRRDGERELQRFKKRAEEVRKVIEGL